MKTFKLLVITYILTTAAFAQEAATTPYDIASEAAAKEVGKIIGRSIGREALGQMSANDQKAILERARAATRGEMLYRYSYEHSPFFNSLYGYISVLREGKNQQEFTCLEYEIDLVVRVNRYFMQVILCETMDGNWNETSAAQVNFPSRTFPIPGNGGWLFPVR